MLTEDIVMGSCPTQGAQLTDVNLASLITNYLIVRPSLLLR